MMQLTAPLSASLDPKNAIPNAWIERIFQRFEDRYGSLWADRFGGFPRARVMATWAEDLADLHRDELTRGVHMCRGRRFPPTLPEFREMCRPPIDSQTAYIEAGRLLRIRYETGADVWPDARLYWAAVTIGAADMQSLPFEALRRRWETALETAKADPVPAFALALPAPGKTMSREAAASFISAIRRKMEHGNIAAPA